MTTENNEGAQDTTETPEQKAEADAAAKAKADAEAATGKDGQEGKEAPKDEKPIPQEYKLALPKDSLLKPETVQEVAEFAKANKLTQEAAQAILEGRNQALSAYVEAELAKVEAVKTQWLEEVKADKEIGGDKLKESAELSKRVVERFYPELAKELDESGVGNHPMFLRLTYRIGKAMSEDSFVNGKQPAGRKSDTDVFYPAQSNGQQ